MLDLNNAGKPEITYPCDWNYKLIGDDVENMLSAVKYAVDSLKYEVIPSNVSKKGNYYSLNVTVTVPNEEKRNEIYKTLEADSSIKFIF